MAPLWAWIVIVVITALIYGFRPHWIWRVRHIPGPWPVWLTGNMLSILAKGSHIYHAELKKTYGPIFKTYGLGRPYVILTSAKLIREALLHSQVRFDLKGLDTICPEFEDAAILFSRGDHWKLLRNFWAPMFFTGSLERYAVLMNGASRRLTKRLDKAADSGELVNLWRWLGELALDIVGMTAFGIELHMQEPVEELSPEDAQRMQKLRQDAATFFAGFASANSRWFIFTVLFPEFTPLIRKLAMRFPDKAMLDSRECLWGMINLTAGLVKQHRASLTSKPDQEGFKAGEAGHEGMYGTANGLASGQKAGSQSSEATTKTRSTVHLRKGVEPGSFLDLLVRQVDSDPSKHLSDLAIAQQVHSVLLAGYETTANTIAFAVHQLILHPDKAAKLRAEIDALPHDPDYEMLEGMTYTDAVIRETLRLFPTGAVAIREATKDMMLGGYKIPAGQGLICSFWSLHRDESLWENAEAFVPERWLDTDTRAAEQRQHAWKAFGDGARGCPGWRFAVEEAKIALYHMFKRFTFTLGPNQDPLPLANVLTLAPKHGVFVHVHRRS